MPLNTGKGYSRAGGLPWIIFMKKGMRSIRGDIVPKKLSVAFVIEQVSGKQISWCQHICQSHAENSKNGVTQLKGEELVNLQVSERPPGFFAQVFRYSTDISG